MSECFKKHCLLYSPFLFRLDISALRFLICLRNISMLMSVIPDNRWYNKKRYLYSYQCFAKP